MSLFETPFKTDRVSFCTLKPTLVKQLFLVAVTDFAMEFSAQKGGFCDSFVADFCLVLSKSS